MSATCQVAVTTRLARALADHASAPRAPLGSLEVVLVLDPPALVVSRGCQPLLVIELLPNAAAWRELPARTRAYAERGVQELWIVPPGAEQIEVRRRLRTGGFGPSVFYMAGERLSSPSLLHFELEVASLFTQA